MHRGTVAIRLSKLLMTAGLAVWAFLVTLGNLTDYDSNWRFVRHVLAMDSIFAGSTLTWRAITDPSIQALAYWTIIAVEGMTSLAFVAATVLMARNLTADKAAFQRAKSVTAIGIALAFGLWFIGFMAVGGEWFAMWQSSQWNGQDAAFRITMIMLAVGVYVFLDNDGTPGTQERANHDV
jgi:predicted small integral membrane protein